MAIKKIIPLQHILNLFFYREDNKLKPLIKGGWEEAGDRKIKVIEANSGDFVPRLK